MTKLLGRMFRQRFYRRGSLTGWMRERGWQYRGCNIWEHPRHGSWETGYAVYEQAAHEHRYRTKLLHWAYLTIITILLGVIVSLILALRI